MGKTTKLFLAMAIIFSLVLVAWATARSVKDVQFSKNCTAHIQKAVNTDNVETAKEELSKAIQYAEEHDLTEGIVSIFFKQPQNDIGVWYKDMKTAYEELERLSENATETEKASALETLRESLTALNQNGRYVKTPQGIIVYPNNLEYFCLGMISFIGACVFWLAFYISRSYD